MKIARRVALGLGASLPLALGVAGAVGARIDAACSRRILRVRNLPRALVGLSILQLSDLHLGVRLRLGDLERVLSRLADDGVRPDMICLTGDIADWPHELPSALRLIEAMKPRLGVFASLGNHEYFHGVNEIRDAYEASGTQLLVGEGRAVRVDDATLFVGGANDPVVIRQPIDGFLRGTIDAAFAQGPAVGCKLLLCHRPEGFDHAAHLGIDVTLAGHTHGGQVGFNGKSAFEPIWPEEYLWGSYARNDSHLYTTSGFGDWFPFRVGCPREAPLIVLERA